MLFIFWNNCSLDLLILCDVGCYIYPAKLTWDVWNVINLFLFCCYDWIITFLFFLGRKEFFNVLSMFESVDVIVIVYFIVLLQLVRLFPSLGYYPMIQYKAYQLTEFSC